MRNNIDPMAIGIQQVLAGLAFPAERWQVIAQAQYYGAGPAYSTELTQLPARTYHSLREVAIALGRLRRARLGRVGAPPPRVGPAPKLPDPRLPAPRLADPELLEPRLPARPGAATLPSPAAPASNEPVAAG
jgi:uncharacterized protein DUF2795